jgi:hypothetical protein
MMMVVVMEATTTEWRIEDAGAHDNDVGLIVVLIIVTMVMVAEQKSRKNAESSGPRMKPIAGCIYMDENGRIGPFLLNLIMASGGYPWTVVPVGERRTYMEGLESASVRETLFRLRLSWLAWSRRVLPANHCQRSPRLLREQTPI